MRHQHTLDSPPGTVAAASCKIQRPTVSGESTLAQPRISIPVLLFLAGRRSRRLRNLDSQCAAVSEV